MRDIVQEATRSGGSCVVLTTHELGEAERLADRVVIIDGGRKVGPRARPPASPRHPRWRDPLRRGRRPPPPLGLREALGEGAAVEEEHPGRYRVDPAGALSEPDGVARLTAWLAARGPRPRRPADRPIARGGLPGHHPGTAGGRPRPPGGTRRTLACTQRGGAVFADDHQRRARQPTTCGSADAAVDRDRTGALARTARCVSQLRAELFDDGHQRRDPASHPRHPRRLPPFLLDGACPPGRDRHLRSTFWCPASWPWPSCRRP